MEQYWLITVIIVLLIVGIVFDGVRRMYQARRDSIKMSLRPVPKEDEDNPLDDDYGSEFPNGGARVSNHKIDPERIQKARSKYNFGGDIPAWREKVANKIAEHTGIKAGGSRADEGEAPRIEPSLDQSVADERAPAPGLEELQEEDVLLAPADEAAKPQQARLNLDETVPMLMDSLGGQAPQAQSIQPVASHIETDADTDLAVETHSANKPRYESKYVDHAKTVSKTRPSGATAPKAAAVAEVFVIHVKAPKDHYFYGSDLLELILSHGLRFGEMDIFHRHTGNDGEGPVLFSMANMVKPGTFDLYAFEAFSTVGLSFFLTLPTVLDHHMDAFDMMLGAAKDIADTLGGELNDEQRSVLTGQTIEHYRERIRDFSRRQQLEKNKL